MGSGKREQKIATRKQQLMAAIEDRPGLSLFKHAINAGLPYVTAHRYMERLEADGKIEIIRNGPGSSLEIQPLESE